MKYFFFILFPQFPEPYNIDLPNTNKKKEAHAYFFARRQNFLPKGNTLCRHFYFRHTASS